MARTKMELNGRVTGRDGYYFKVNCPLAPSYLQTLYLEPWAVRSARIGDLVLLAYRETNRSGSWVVTEVLSA